MNPQPPAAHSLTRSDDLAAVIRDAVIYHPSSDMNDDNLLSATREFIGKLEVKKIPLVLVGGLAVLQYVDGRNTRDIDLIIAIDNLDKLSGFTLEEKSEWFASGTSGPVKIELLFTANPLFALVSETLLNTLATHMPASDINALCEVLADIHSRLNRPNKF